MIATVLTIAGSDPTGGAGIQADLKTMTAIGVYGAAAITCITVQNSYGVKKITPLPPELVAEQIRAVFEDHHVSHVKIGMVGTLEIARIITTTLSDFPGEVIIDPVLTSTTGQPLVSTGEIDGLQNSLLREATVLTPNLPELAILAGSLPLSGQDAVNAAETFFALNKKLQAVLIKGGHSPAEDEITDILVYRTGQAIKTESLRHKKIASRNTHGTGCTLASAFAAFHCLGGDYLSSFRSAVDYLQKTIKNSASAAIVKNPAGQGGLIHPAAAGKL